VENNTRTNYNRTTGERRKRQERKQKTLDVNDLLIETRLCENCESERSPAGMSRKLCMRCQGVSPRT
jgi:hypothetical protein